ncbi:MAG TPA: FKBP-type peptidyl-prolyl cis-trans isomerase [Bacteroidales bacterium]|nr:FKBP-type peptidyl-prolyl cis-trans isomerase [Bacteroidales bacterium]
MMVPRIFILIPLIVIVSCNNDNTTGTTSSRPGKQDMEDMNRYFVQKDRERIVSYIERKGLKMNETPSGLWYQVINEGSGNLLKEGSRLNMEYECSLLDGTVCYSSSVSGPRQLVLGRTGIEPGLYEGLMLLKPGSEAIFIMPPYMAYGLPGDGKKIPPRSVIVYHLRLLNNE